MKLPHLKGIYIFTNESSSETIQGSKWQKPVVEIQLFSKENVHDHTWIISSLFTTGQKWSIFP